jgi:predicted nucleotide-binding protein (sugar kinase/HSP70/actin superfamily)
MKKLFTIFLFLLMAVFSGCQSTMPVMPVPKTFNQVYAEIDGLEATALDTVNKSPVSKDIFDYVHAECKKIDEAKKAARASYHAGDNLDGINKVLAEAMALSNYLVEKGAK